MVWAGFADVDVDELLVDFSILGKGAINRLIVPSLGMQDRKAQMTEDGPFFGMVNFGERSVALSPWPIPSFL